MKDPTRERRKFRRMVGSRAAVRRSGGCRRPVARHLVLPLALLAALVPSFGAVTSANATTSAVDLGTLGGSYSVAHAVNDSGQVAGYSASPTGQPLAFSWTEAGGMLPIDLGGGYSLAFDVNNSGQVVGWGLTAGGQIHAFSWTQSGGITDLGTLGGDYSYTYDVSESGQVVGHSADAGGFNYAYSWTQSGGMISLGRGVASGVNSSGRVVGQTFGGPPHAFSWTSGGGRVDLGTVGGDESHALAVNDDGQAVGYSTTSGGQHHAMSWTESGGMIDLGTLGGNSSDAIDVNSSGQVVGQSSPSVFLWTQSGGMVDLGTLGGQGSQLSGEGGKKINDDGQVVGSSHTVDEYGHAFSWTQAGGMVDLGTLPGGTESAANALNATGQVVGWSLTAGGDQHATLWNTAASKPDAPTNVQATPGNQQVTVTWTALSDGGSPITGYEVVVSPGGLIVPASAGATQKVITGLTNCIEYTFVVRAINAAGTGPDSSPPAAATPSTTAVVQVGETGTGTNVQPSYTPKQITVPVEQCVRIRWTFNTTNLKQHTVTEAASPQYGLGPANAPLFNSGLVGPGGSFTSPLLRGASFYQYHSVASGDSNSPSAYGSVRMPIVVSPSSGVRTTPFTVQWAKTPITGYAFSVQYQFKVATQNNWGQWTTWTNPARADGLWTGTSATFTPSQVSPNQNKAGDYRFQARIKNLGTGKMGGWSWSAASGLVCPCQVAVAIT